MFSVSVSGKGHSCMLMLPFSCDGIRELYVLCNHSSDILVWSCTLVVLFVPLVRTVVFSFELGLFSSNNIPVHDVPFCHSYDSLR